MQERIGSVLAELERADAATRAFAERAGLACPPGCGACCLSPDVETTAAECLPLAEALAADGRADEVLAELARRRAAGDPRCALYAADPRDERLGRCTAYALRPLVCRLFGFSGRRDRTGATALVSCRTLRAADPAAQARAEELARAGGAPLLADHAHAVAAALPGDGARQLPVNEALRAALERVLLARRLRDLEAEEAAPLALVTDGDGDPDPGRGAPRPGRPPRRAA